MNTALMFSSKSDEWSTPQDFWDVLDAEFGFDVDVAANDENAKCQHYIGPGSGDATIDDALAIEWATCLSMIGRPPVCWCNPPYSRGLQRKFIEKASLERVNGVLTVMLLPARTDTKSFHGHIWNADAHAPYKGVEVRFIKGRLKFGGCKDAAPFPSMIVIFRP